MTTLDILLATVLAMTTVGNACAQAQTLKPWSPAKYHDLIVGTSTRENVLTQLGKPLTTGREQDTGIPIMTYRVSNPVQGTLVVYLHKGILDGMTLLPKNRVTRRDLLRLYGTDYLVVRYATDDCLTEGGTAPIYETPDGAIEHIEYRDRGVAAIVRDGEVRAVVFVSKPFGPTHSQCAHRAPKN